MNELIQRTGFYFAEYHQVIKAWIPIILTCLVFMAILWAATFLTKKLTDKKWIQNPEQVKKNIQVKLACHIKTIEGLLKTVDELKEEKRRLLVTIKAGVDMAQRTANVLNGGK